MPGDPLRAQVVADTFLTTISDYPFKSIAITPEERQNSFTNMMKVALDTVVDL